MLRSENQSGGMAATSDCALGPGMTSMEIDKYACVATLNEVEENDFSLNIPRYVDTFEKEEPESPGPRYASDR